MNKIQLVMLLALTLVIACSSSTDPDPIDPDPMDGPRWGGNDFVFCFATDDGTLCNLGWADLARENDFRFTMGVNPGRYNQNKISDSDLKELQQDGFEIAQHGWSHGFDGLSGECDIPPRGSLVGYFECEPAEGVDITEAFNQEVSRSRLADYADIPESSIKVTLYPRHQHSIEVIDGLIENGFIGARFGGNNSYINYGNGDFSEPAKNSWDGGISLYRVPVMCYTHQIVGNHSAAEPEFFTYEQFVEAITPIIDQAKIDGGIAVLYAHHFGDTIDDPADINYGSGGLTVEELGWVTDFVKANGGRIMTLGDAIEHYRSRSDMIEVDGDYVWVARPEE